LWYSFLFLNYPPHALLGFLHPEKDETWPLCFSYHSLSSMFLFFYVTIYLSIYLPIYPSICLSIDRSIYLSI
jgi:hypothetical protein